MNKQAVLGMVAALVAGLLLSVQQAQAYNGEFTEEYKNGFAEEDRTANRDVSAKIAYPGWLTAMPEHYPFLPHTSNTDAQNDHPAQWDGQDWDSSKWDGQDWTPEKTIRRFYSSKILTSQYMDGKRVPVLELGPTFFRLSDLDQRRVLKLVADHSGIFERNFKMIDLRDWHTKKSVGAYTPRGMFLN